MKNINKLFNKFNPFTKNRKHPKDETPVEDINDQAPYNINDNNNNNNNTISSGSANTKNTLSSGSSHQISSGNNDEANNDNIQDKYKAQRRTNRARTSVQQRNTYSIFPADSAIPRSNPKPGNKNKNKPASQDLAEIDDEAQEKDVLSSFCNSFSDRITINLPLDELNASSLRADVLLSMAKDKAELLDKSVTETEKKMDDVSSQMKTIINKSRSLTQTAAVINAKLVNIDDWIDRIGSDKSDFKISIVEFFVSMLSFLTTIFSLMWFSFRRKSIKTKNS